LRKKNRFEDSSMTKVLDALQTIRQEMNLILHRLGAIEDRIGESMTEDDERALNLAIEEHARGETIPLDEARKLRDLDCPGVQVCLQVPPELPRGCASKGYRQDRGA